MATKEQFEKLSRRERQNRYFSESFKRKKVDEIDRNISTVSEISKEYQVSQTAIYKWIYKYSSYRQREVKQVIEMESDTRKIEALKEQIKQLEQLLGQKQVLIEFQDKVLEIASQETGIDLKKRLKTLQSAGSCSIPKNTKSR